MSTATAPAPTTAPSHDRGKLTYIDLADVHIDHESNVREESRHTEADIENLAGSIEESNGLIQPIMVRELPPALQTKYGKKYQLDVGFGRVQALGLLASNNEDDSWIKSVPATIKVYSTELNRTMDQLAENIRRKNMTPMEQARMFKELLDDPKNQLSPTVLSRRLGLPKATVTNYVRMNNLPAEIQDMIAKEVISWSHGREIEALDLDKEHQLLLAKTAATMTFPEFAQHLEKHYKSGGSATGDEAVSSGNGQTRGTQKTSQTVRADVIREKYLPYFVKQAESAKNGQEKAKWQDRIDTMNFVLNVAGTKLATELAPWEKQLEEEKEKKDTADRQEAAKNKYIRTQVTAISKTMKEQPPEFLADGKPNPKRELPTFAEALARAKATLEADIKEAEKEGAPKGHARLKGEKDTFPVADVNKFMDDVTAAFHQTAKKREDDRKKREEQKKKAKEEADAKAKSEAEAGKEAVATG